MGTKKTRYLNVVERILMVDNDSIHGERQAQCGCNELPARWPAFGDLLMTSLHIVTADPQLAIGLGVITPEF